MIISAEIIDESVAIINNNEVSLILQSQSVISYKFEIEKYQIIKYNGNFIIQKINEQNLNFKFANYDIDIWPQRPDLQSLYKTRIIDDYRRTNFDEQHEFNLSIDSNLVNQFIPFSNENNFKCIFCFLKDPKGKNKIFVFNDAATGMYSWNQDLIGVTSMTYEQFYIWEVRSLANAKLADEMHRDIDYIGNQLWTLPKHYVIDVKMRKIIFFAKLPNTENLSNLMVIAVYDNMSMAKLEQDTLIHKLLIESYNVKLGFTNIYDISLDDKFLVVLGKDNEKSLLRIFDTMFGNVVIEIPVVQACVSDRVWMNFGKKELFLKSQHDFLRISFNFNSDIMCLNDNSVDQIRFLKFSPRGNYIIFKIYKRSKRYYRESHFGFMPYAKRSFVSRVEDSNVSVNYPKSSIDDSLDEIVEKYSNFKKDGIYFKNHKIQNIDISDDEKSLITLESNKISILSISNPDISYVKEFQIGEIKPMSNYWIDVSGCIPEESSYRKNDCKRTCLTKDYNLIFVLHDKENNRISVAYFNIENNMEDLEITTLYNYEMINVNTTLYPEDESQGGSSGNLGIWSQCVWNFSLDSSKVYFYFMRPEISEIAIFDLNLKKVSKVINFGITLLNENIFINNFLFSINGESIITYNYKTDQLCLIEPNSGNIEIEELVETNGNYFELRLSSENTIFILGNNKITNKIEIKKIDFSEITGGKKVSFLKHLSFPMNRQKKSLFKENLIICETNDNIAYTSTQNDGKKFYNTILLWWHYKSLFQTEIYDYNIIKILIGKTPEFEDIKEILRPELINRINDRFWSPLMSVAYDNVDSNVLEKTLDFLLKNKTYVYYLTDKLRYAPISSYNTHSDVISMCIKMNSIKNLKVLFKYLHKGITYNSELALLICICKDELLSNYKFLYKELFKIKKKSKWTFKMEKKKFKKQDYICIADDSEMRDLRSFNDKYEKVIGIFKEFDEKTRNKEYPSVNLVLKNLKEVIRIPKKIEAEIKVFLYDSDKLSEDKIMSILNFIDVEFYIFPWVDFAYAGYASFLHHILENKLEIQAFEELSVKKVIDLKWTNYISKYYNGFLILHICLILTYTLYVIYDTDTFINVSVTESSDGTSSTNVFRVTADNRHEVTGLRLVMSSAALIVSFLSLAFSMVQFFNIYKYRRKVMSSKRKSLLSALKLWAFKSHQLLEYLVYLYILIDTIGAFFNLTEDYYALYVIKAFVICLLWWKCLYFLLPIKRLMPLVLMFYTIFEDVGIFICILIFLFFGFSTAFYSLFYYPGNHIITSDGNNGNPLFTSFLN